ncbi:hypothetical protein [Paenibacillus sp. FSL R7-0331]|uniref:hypothetical protein n=1 Tax=Paenibacillus sp. FSL R7-0331 TaxID=1536773 RepID=UPI0004F8A6BD|nr:hypothetical protein [Paenibacillus sp. FSL R7-0331]AIQ52691.1 hypothetical protein R70331_14985 [Paenibacillus sp. FSL R7-0331]
MYEYGLIVATKSRTLPSLNSFYLEYEDEDSENIEGGYDTKSERYFWINHKQLNEFISKMGESNFFSIHRVFLSYYEAFNKLRDFWNFGIPQQIFDKEDTLLISDIETMLNSYNVSINDSKILKYANYISNDGVKKYIETNPFQEYLWSIQMSELLESYNISPFDRVEIAEKSILKSSYIFKGAIVKKEISVVLYEWANINSFVQSDFIKRLSNILEVIINDVYRNTEEYTKKSKNQKVNQLVNSIIRQVDKGSWRKYFFGIFNASDLLGAYSRHSSNEIAGISGVNTLVDIDLKTTIDKWKNNHTLPNDEQFLNMFKLWYFTTSFLIINWLRLPHFSND